MYEKESIRQANCQPSCRKLWFYSLCTFKEWKMGHFMLCPEWRYQSKWKKSQFKHFKKAVCLSAVGLHHLLARHPRMSCLKVTATLSPD